jgi:hypothetical protein
MGIRLMVSGLDIRVFFLELEEFVISLDYLGETDAGASTTSSSEPAWRKEKNSWTAPAHTFLNHFEDFCAAV